MQEVVDLPDKNALKRGRHGRRKVGKSGGGELYCGGHFLLPPSCNRAN